MGLREQIKNAGSEIEVDHLISKGKTFDYVSDKTRNAWKSTARSRIVELNKKTSTPQTDPDLSTKKSKTAKK
jgi:hypothetical protein